MATFSSAVHRVNAPRSIAALRGFSSFARRCRVQMRPVCIRDSIEIMKHALASSGNNSRLSRLQCIPLLTA
eukprot:5980582-Pleurochrysis_carterae.AAC.1